MHHKKYLRKVSENGLHCNEFNLFSSSLLLSIYLCVDLDESPCRAKMEEIMFKRVPGVQKLRKSHKVQEFQGNA